MTMINNSLVAKVDTILNDFEAQAVIFDLDGTLLDNNPYHLQSWKKYLENIGRDMTEEEYNANINGRTNKDVIDYIHGDVLNEEDSLKYSLEKEALYREIYKPFIKPVNGLLAFLDILRIKIFRWQSLLRVFSPTLILCLITFLSNNILK